jgi:asparagine synthase (glutamine-hydrolysing)
MCGIIGMVKCKVNSNDIKKVVLATEKIKHRGPDDEGYVWLPFGDNEKLVFAGDRTDVSLNLPHHNQVKDRIYGTGAILAHNRLSIIDLSRLGHQPMSYDNKKIWIVFNGEIYNYLELKAELESYGKLFTTNSDTEVILAAYSHWGIEAVKRFVGMFAFILFDGRDVENPVMWMARDPFGIKPLYYSRIDGEICFCSEVKGLLAMGLSRSANPNSIRDYLLYAECHWATETFFEGITQLEAGCYAKINLAGEPFIDLIKKYWCVSEISTQIISWQDAIEQGRELFLKSVKLHLRADVPTGSALSGGVDSSSIVGSIRYLDPICDLSAFGFVAEEDAINEEKWMEMAAEAAGAKLYKTRATHDELVNDLEALIFTQDEPFGSTSIYAQFRVFQLVKENDIKVSLDGQGADEILAGYPFFCGSYFASQIYQGSLFKGLAFLKNAENDPLGGGFSLFKRSILALFPLRLRQKVLSAREQYWNNDVTNNAWFKRNCDSDEYLKNISARNRLHEDLNQALSRHTLPAFLRYADRNSMVSSIESRVPFLTTDLVSFFLSLPEEYLISPAGKTKAVFRESMRGLVPDSILDRRDKVGFQTTERQWLASLKPWIDSKLKKDILEQVPCIDINNLLAYWDKMANGEVKYDNRFWRWLNLICWSEKFNVLHNK